jgi:hypothetical protein
MGNTLNEVINGFKVPDFERTIGVPTGSLERLLRQIHTLHATEELTLDVIGTRAVRNALRETILELGIEEFQTRTGYDFQEGEAILLKLNRLLGE